MKTKSLFVLTIAAVFISISVSGCGLGPKMIKPERKAYSVALQTSANEEMLLNLVRKRYSEMPVFMRITALTSTLTLSSTATGTASFPEIPYTDSYDFTLDATISETPTITFQPLEGADFSKSALTEIGLGEVMTLFRAGWDIEKLMKVMIKRIGPIQNDPRAPEEEEKFARLSALWGRVQRRGDLGFTIKPGNSKTVGVPFKKSTINVTLMMSVDKGGYRIECDDQGDCRLIKSADSILAMQAHYRDEEEAREAASILNITPDRKIKTPNGGVLEEIQLFIGSNLEDHISGDNKGRVPIQMRSLNTIITHLSHGVRIPDEDRMYASSTSHENGEPVNWDNYMRDILEVHVTDSKPSDAHVRVSYRGRWFSISDSDENSKTTLLLMNLIFALQSGNPTSSGPILTLPVGG